MKMILVLAAIAGMGVRAHAENILECGKAKLYLDYLREDGVALVDYGTFGGFGTITKLG